MDNCALSATFTVSYYWVGALLAAAFIFVGAIWKNDKRHKQRK